MSARVHVWLRLLAIVLAALAGAVALSPGDGQLAPMARDNAAMEASVLPSKAAARTFPPLFAATPGPLAWTLSATADGPPEMIGVAGRLPDDVEVLVRLPNGTSVSLRAGESAAGWKLVSAAVDRAVFERGSERRIVTLAAGP